MKVSDGYIVFLFILSRLYILSPRFQINPRVVPWNKIHAFQTFYPRESEGFRYTVVYVLYCSKVYVTVRCTHVQSCPAPAAANSLTDYLH